MNELLIDKLFKCDAIEAVVLGGSRATGVFDEKSDYDYYVYLTEDLSENERKMLLDEFVSYMEYSNHFWELEDDGILNNGVDIEFIYRSIDDITKSVENLLVKGNVSTGYTTCFVDNIIKSKVIFDKNGRYKLLQQNCKKLLNNDIYDKIVHSNFPIIMDRMPSLYFQVEKAIIRNDILSMNHRSSAYFDLYFDIVFAVNKVTHPGEKRMLDFALTLPLQPKNMEMDIIEYFDVLFTRPKDAITILYTISINLYDLLTVNDYEVKIRSYK